MNDPSKLYQEIEESEQFFRSVVENSYSGIYASDENFLFTYVNDKLCEISGYTREELLGTDLRRLIAEESLPFVADRYIRRQNGEDVPSRYEFTGVRKNGEKLFFETNAVAVKYPDGRVRTIGQILDITTHKRADEALRASETFLETIIENSPYAMSVCNETGTLIRMNQACRDLLQVTDEDMIGNYNILEDNILEQQGMMPQVKRVFEKGEPVHFILDDDTAQLQSIQLEKTVHVIMDVTISPVLDQQGQVIYVIVQTADITERKRTEEALRESEEKYRLIAENMVDVISVLDMNLQTTYISPSVVRLRGVTAEEALMETLEQVMTSESLKTVLAAFEEEMKMEAGGTSDPSRMRIMELEEYRKDGSTVWVEASSSYLRDENNKPLGLLSITRDISKRKQAEEELRRVTAFLDSIVENIPDMIFVKDAKDLRFVLYNRAGEELLGYSRNDLLGKSDYDFFPKEQADFFTEKDRNVLNSGRIMDVPEEPIQTRNKGDRIIHTKKVPILDVKGKPEYLMGISEDITDQKRTEEEKRSLEERLQRAEKMEALGTLAGGVAHDLNNVLGIVIGYAELLLCGIDESSTMKSSLQNIMDGGQRATAIVQDLLTLARRGVPNRQVLNLNAIISDFQCLPELETLSSYHPSVQIKTDLEPDLLNISGSSVHLGKSLFNLASNATEAMPQGGTLTIKTANRYLDKPVQGYDEIREGDYVVLSMSDTGEGIPKSDLKRIFEPFYTKKVMGRSGTGLGLAVVWGTVKDHNGYINVESEEGKGSTFTLYFPVTRESVSLEAAAVSISEYMGRGESILIVDDIKGQRDLAAEMLRKLDYNVESVSGGEEAVAYMKGHSVDLIILDMIMDPGMDGLDTYRSILEFRPAQKAIIVSGFSETSRVNAAQTLGAGAYVRKPYIMEKLGMAVRKELDKK